jgi:large subunit ribosomal protein L49
MLQTILPRAAAPSRILLQRAAPTSTFLRSTPFRRRITTETAQSAPSTLSPAASQTVTISAPSEPVPKPAYLVSRTPSKSLPVYQRAKRGGNMKFTLVKKIEGDIRGLKSQLKADLGLDDKKIKINHVTGHIEISVRLKMDPRKHIWHK